MHGQFSQNFLKTCCCCCLVISVVSDYVRPYGLQPARLLCPSNSPGKSTGVGCYALLQGIVLTWGLNPGLLHCTQILYHLNHQGNPDYRHISIQKDQLSYASNAAKYVAEGHALYPVVFLTTCADTRQGKVFEIRIKETYNIMRKRIKMKIDFRTHCSSVWQGLRKSVGLSNNSNSQSRDISFS